MAYRRWLLAIWMSLLAGCAAPMQYSSSEFSGHVKDKLTGAPISGAVVIATWQQSRPKFFHGTLSDVLHVSEAVTDENGKYTLKAWGPKLRRPFWKLDVYDTGSIVFKPGYRFESIVGHNIGDKSEIPPALRPVTLLGPIDEKLEDYASRLGIITRSHCCVNEQLERNPYLIILLDEERRRLTKLGVSELWLNGIVNLDKLSTDQQRFLERQKLPK